MRYVIVSVILVFLSPGACEERSKRDLLSATQEELGVIAKLGENIGSTGIESLNTLTEDEKSLLDRVILKGELSSSEEHADILESPKDNFSDKNVTNYESDYESLELEVSYLKEMISKSSVPSIKKGTFQKELVELASILDEFYSGYLKWFNAEKITRALEKESSREGLEEALLVAKIGRLLDRSKIMDVTYILPNKKSSAVRFGTLYSGVMDKLLGSKKFAARRFYIRLAKLISSADFEKTDEENFKRVKSTIDQLLSVFQDQ